MSDVLTIPCTGGLSNFKGKIHPTPSNKGKTWTWKKAPSPQRQAVALQDAVFKSAMENKSEPQELCKLAGVWAQVEDRRQVLAGVGRPKPVEAKNTRSKSKKHSAPAMVDPTDHGHQPETPAPEVPNP